MKITKSHFQQLPEGEKSSRVLDEGKHISTRKVDHYYVSLYNMDEFMVEIWYHIANNKIEQVEIVEDNSILDKYIDEEINKKKFR